MLYAIKIRLNADDEGRLWGGVWQREDHAERLAALDAMIAADEKGGG